MTTLRIALVVALSLFLVACPGEDPPDGNNGTDNSNNGTANNTANNTTNGETCNDCSSVGFSCDGNVLVDCRERADGCRQAARVDCDPSGRVCDADRGVCSNSTCNDEPACVGATAGQAYCDESQLFTCTDDGSGCLRAMVEDCSGEGRICSPEDQACVDTCADEPTCADSEDGAMTCNLDETARITCVDSNGDGCLEVSETLDCDAGLACVTTGVDAICADVCGNGVVTGDEACDDGNTVDDDGCSAACQPDLFGECDATGSNCIAYEDLGSYGVGDPIPGIVGNALDGVERYKITFEDWMYFNGSWSNPDGSTLNINLYNEFDRIWLNDLQPFDGSWTDQGVAPGSYVLQVRADSAVTSYSVSMSGGAPTSIGTFAANAPIPDTDGMATSFDAPVWYLITLTDDVVLNGTIKGVPMPASFELYGLEGQMLRGELGESVDNFEIALFAGTYFARVVPRTGNPLTSFSLPAWSTVPMAGAITDLGTVGAGDAIADQAANLAPGGGAFYRVEFTSPVRLGRFVSPATPLLWSVYDDAMVRLPADTIEPGEYIVSFINDGTTSTGDVTISMTADAP